jgi:hypothetical protein
MMAETAETEMTVSQALEAHREFRVNRVQLLLSAMMARL